MEIYPILNKPGKGKYVFIFILNERAVLSGGCQWRRLPHDYPKWKSVYYYYHKWRMEGRVEHFLEKLVRKVRRKRGQTSSPTVAAIDAQSVKWGSRHGDNGYDGNKKVKGVKRNILTDRNGFILARKVCNAGIHDSKTAHELCGQVNDIWEDLEKFLSDRGCRGDVAQPISRKISALSLKYPTRQTESKGFFPNLCDGWWKELSHGLTLVADSPGTMRY